jgi:hypothetical protein
MSSCFVLFHIYKGMKVCEVKGNIARDTYKLDRLHFLSRGHSTAYNSFTLCPQVQEQLLNMPESFSVNDPKEALLPGVNPRFLGSQDGGPRTDAILFRPPSICERVFCIESAERIIRSISCFNIYSCSQSISIAVCSLSPPRKHQHEHNKETL